jgi:hypothetical protein
MATWYALTTITAPPSGAVPPGNPQTLFAGHLVDDTKTPLAPFQALGGVFWPASDPTVAAAAAIATKLHAQRGQNEAAANAVMLGAALSALLNGTPPTQAGSVKVQTLTLALAGIQALTSATAFNVGAPLPTGAVLIGANAVWTAITGGSLSQVHLIIGDATTSNDILATTDVHGSSSFANASAVQARSAAQIQATLTTVGDTLANATAGALTINLYYSIG